MEFIFIFFICRYNHITVIDVACVVGVRDCKEFVKTVYREWMDNPVKNP